MKTRSSLLIIAVALLTSGLFADAETVSSLAARTFKLRYKDADKAAAALRPLMSASGSISIQPSGNTLVVTDRPENLKEIAAVVAKYDVPAQAFRLKVRLVSAARVELAAAKVSDDLKDIAPKLAVLRYNSLEDLGELSAEGREGDPFLIDLPSGYRAELKFGEYDPVSDSIKVTDFKLSRFQGAQKEQLNQLLKTSINLKVGQTVILGAAKLPESQRALMIVVSATRAQ
jgi:hypothetical protein